MCNVKYINQKEGRTKKWKYVRGTYKYIYYRRRDSTFPSLPNDWTCKSTLDYYISLVLPAIQGPWIHVCVSRCPFLEAPAKKSLHHVQERNAISQTNMLNNSVAPPSSCGIYLFRLSALTALLCTFNGRELKDNSNNNNNTNIPMEICERTTIL